MLRVTHPAFAREYVWASSSPHVGGRHVRTGVYHCIVYAKVLVCDSSFFNYSTKGLADVLYDVNPCIFLESLSVVPQSLEVNSLADMCSPGLQSLLTESREC